MSSSAPYPRRWWTLAVLCLQPAHHRLDNTDPQRRPAHAGRATSAPSSSQLQWIVDAYTLVFAGLLLTAGSLGDRFGRKRALIAGLVVFGAGSLAAAFASAADRADRRPRARWASARALIMPATLSILTNVFTDPPSGPKAIGIWAGVSRPRRRHRPDRRRLAARALLVGLGLPGQRPGRGRRARRRPRSSCPTRRRPGRPPLDPLGAVLSIAGLVALALGDHRGARQRAGPTRDRSARFAVGAVAARRRSSLGAAHRPPDARRPLLHEPRFTAASCAITLAFFAMFGSMFFLTQYLQFVLGFTPARGRRCAVPVAAWSWSRRAARATLAARFGTKLVVAAGLRARSAAGARADRRRRRRRGVLADRRRAGRSSASAWAWRWRRPPTRSWARCRASKAGVGSAVNDTTREVGGALGVAILGSLLSSGYRGAMDAATQGLPAPAARRARLDRRRRRGRRHRRPRRRALDAAADARSSTP